MKKLTIWGAIATLPAGLGMWVFPTMPADARNQFDVCVQQIQGTGVPVTKAKVACSDALIPKELSRCVSQIKGRTSINPEDALEACYQVRRPVDLANCVTDINRAIPLAPTTTTGSYQSEEGTPLSLEASSKIESDPSLFSLESCRRSLLPGRYSECVIALSRNGEETSPVQAMKTCLTAEDFPREIFPTYPQN
ncbi:hypothetical protein [Aphanothece hegewaldii]|uniref:hypothetical protein n=1 Tax=Aphanothece hegewaldii TaxID=1521625 RepID=UPI001FE33BEB|nr:hypothetical protein [Aphanothece hegewaldii]